MSQEIFMLDKSPSGSVVVLQTIAAAVVVNITSFSAGRIGSERYETDLASFFESQPLGEGDGVASDAGGGGVKTMRTRNLLVKGGEIVRDVLVLRNGSEIVVRQQNFSRSAGTRKSSNTGNLQRFVVRSPRTRRNSDADVAGGVDIKTVSAVSANGKTLVSRI